MEKIKELLKKLLEKIGNIINNKEKGNETKMLEKANRYTWKAQKYRMVEEQEMIQEEYAVKDATLAIGGLELPIGSFDIQRKNGEVFVDIKEEVTISPDGKMYIKGKQICKNEKIQEEIARQIKQNGKPSQVVMDSSGEIVKTDSEKYRNEMYDDDARKRTEQVSNKWNENREQEKENERDNEDNAKQDENEQSNR